MLAGPRLVVAPCPRSVAGTLNISSSGRPSSSRCQETVYETQQVSCVRNVCETVMQPRTITTHADGHRAVRPRGALHGPEAVLPDGLRASALHGPAAGLRGRSGRRARTPSAGRSARRTREPDVHGLPAGPRDDVQDLRLQRLHAGPRGRRTRSAATRSAGRCRRPRSRRSPTRSAGRCRRRATRTAPTRSASRCRRPATGRSPTRCRCRSSRR